MKVFSAVSIVTVFAALIGFSGHDEPIPVKKAKAASQIQTYFFTESEEQLDKQYYYALLKLQNKHSRDFNIKIIKKDKAQNRANHLAIHSYPALVIMYDGQVLLKVEGKHFWSDIYDRVKAKIKTISYEDQHP